MHAPTRASCIRRYDCCVVGSDGSQPVVAGLTFDIINPPVGPNAYKVSRGRIWGL